MKTLSATKIIALCVLLLFGGQTANAQTTTNADYSRMGLLELSTRASKGDQKAAAALKKRLNSDAYNLKPKKNANAPDPNAPVLGTTKGLGISANDLAKISAGTKPSNPTPKQKMPRRFEDMRKELDEVAAKIRVSLAKIKAGTYGAKDKKETAALLVRVKELTAAIKIREIADKLEYLKKSNKIVGETAKIITKSLTFVWTMKPAELRALAEKGDLEAQVELARRYDDGKRGFEKDAVASFEWMLKASKGGYAIAQKSTASHYFYGEGVTKNDAKAAYWLKKSAKNGYKFAQFQLHKEYEEYFGLTGWKIFPKDLAKAKYWLDKAIAQGFDLAILHKIGEHPGE